MFWGSRHQTVNRVLLIKSTSRRAYGSRRALSFETHGLLESSRVRRRPMARWCLIATTAQWDIPVSTIDVKNVFLRFLFLFHVFKRFLYFQTFLFLNNVGKVQSGKQINKKHFQNNSNEIDLWFFRCMLNDLKCLPINFYLLTMFDACLNGIFRVALKAISFGIRRGVELSHARTVVRECCKGDDESQWERGKFDPRHPKTP